MCLVYKKQKQPPDVFFKEGVLRNFAKFARKHLCQSLFFNKDAGLQLVCNFIKKETLAQVLSCEFCEISKNTFFKQHPWATASDNSYSLVNSIPRKNE